MALTAKTSSPKHTIDDLNSFYSEGETCDGEVFAEQRSNLLLVAGEHYSRRQATFFKRLRESRDVSQEQKLRLTKNHIQNICKIYANNIISATPGVGFEPKDEQSIQDQKAAELHHSVWQDANERYGIQTHLIDGWCDNFIQIGEVYEKIFWDPMAGDIKAFEQKVDEMGQPVHLDPNGEETPESHDVYGQPHQLAPDFDLPVFSGAFVFEDVYGFNLLRSPQAKRMEESPYLIVRKMVPISEMKKRYEKDPAKLKFFQESSEDTFLVMSGSRGSVKKTEGMCMLREYYFRPCPEYPNGYFYFTTKEGIFEQDELPGGVFPIVGEPYETIQTTCRGRSPIKHMRPYQVEINRAASKMAEHQVTLGDDKLAVQNGTKVSAGVALPGIRAVNYTGEKPTLIPGRSGEQYLGYMQSQTEELYQVMNVALDSEKEAGQLDPFALLFRSASQKKKFQRYTKRFENFLMNVCKTYLRLAKVHLPDDAIIWAVGKSEQINIPEFKNAKDISYQIIVEAQSDDIETKLGKQMVLNHVLQYVGTQLKPEDIGKLMRQMPYANFDGSFDDMTIDYDTIENDLLALDRGEQPPMNNQDNHVYCIKRLSLRQRKPDYQFLPPQVKSAYDHRLDIHEQMEAQRQVQLQRAQQGYIPTGGAMLGCDFFVSDPANPSKTRRARLPSESVQWLVTQLEAQGQGLDQIESMTQGAQAQVAGFMLQQPGGVPQPRPGVNHTSALLPQGMGLSGSRPQQPSSPPRRFMPPQMPAQMGSFRGP